MHTLFRRGAVAATAVAAATGGLLVALPAAQATDSRRPAAARHVLLISVDGLHASDLAWYVKAHPSSALAVLEANGTAYSAASTTFPSDSFPGMVAQLTGADPGTSGIYYDDTYNPTLLPAGTRNCTTATAGTEVAWTEAAARSQNPITLDSGQGLSAPALAALTTNTAAQTQAAAGALTKAILALTPNPQSLLDPSSLPVDPATCLPVYPHSYLKVNTVFEVARAHGLTTAWSDKHAAYEILSGPSGTGIQDLFTPEINSVADAAGDDWTKDNLLTQEYDSFKVAAVLNEIDGLDHSGTRTTGVPAVFGLNFQSVSTAQKLPTSDGLTGGYTTDGTPGPLLSKALDYVDTQLRAIEDALVKQHLVGDTTLILSAKHGQSPIDPAALRRVDDSAIVTAINTAWAATHPKQTQLVAFATDDDGMLLWLSDHSAGAQAFVKSYLTSHSAPANTITDAKGVYSTSVASSGLSAVYTGNDADRFVGAPLGDSRTPDVIGVAQHGVVYTGGVKKIAEHGGDAVDDRAVAMVVAGAGVAHAATNSTAVQTTQIAPTILTLLGLDPRDLTGVRADHTAALPGVA